MKKTLFFLILLAALLLSACAASKSASQDQGWESGDAVPAEAPMERNASGAEPAAPPAAMPPEAPAAEAASSGADNTLDIAAAAQSDRMVIKNAELRLLVQDTDVAIDGVTQTVADIGGYIVSSRVWYQDWWDGAHKYAAITLAVPADDFELAMRRLRNLGLKVLNEQASGQDVTDQYVDLQSQLDNLEATRQRLRSFLEQAQTVEESLEVNRALSDIEAQIEQIQGRINYLSQRAAYSSITVNLEPDLPPQPTPTPSPTPTPQVWNPGQTFQEAASALTSVYHSLVDIFIWLVVVFLPVILPFALIAWVAVRFLRRKG